MKKKNITTKKTKGQKVVSIIAGILSATVLLVSSVVAVISGKNVKAMNHCVDSVLAKLQEHYTVTPIDVGAYKEMKLFGIMKFHVEQYEIEELGNLSIMRTNMGVMQMATAVITPKDKNLPLLSTDYMYILSNRKVYLEYYDLVKEKDEQYEQLLNALSDAQKNYEYLEDVEPSPAWYEYLLTVDAYKAGSLNDDTALEKMLIDSLSVYLEYGKQMPLLSEEEKKEKIAITMEYSDGLINRGGISTDIFKKALGVEATKKFFDNVFFGTTVE